MLMIIDDSWRVGGEIEKVIKLVFREGFYCSDNEFLIDVALAFSHPIDLAY